MNEPITKDWVTTLVGVTCAGCGCIFGLSEHYSDQRREDHNGFTCPNGHSNIFSGPSPREKAERESARLKAALDQESAGRREATARADRAEISRARLKRRMVAGACALCHRTFSNVAKHMAHKHPEQVKEARIK